MSGLAVAPNAERLAEMAAARVAATASAAIAERGRFSIALSGGSTPRPLYRLLAREPWAETIDWSHVDVFWGDERCVGPDHPDSNYRMARRALLDHVAIPKDRVHRILGELPAREAAAAYQVELRRVLGDEGRLDLVLLGLGSDGHTASLFPGTDAVLERRRDVVAVYVEKLDTWRITLTLPIINRARQVVFLVSGASKANTVARTQGGDELPAGMVQPTDGTLIWLIDREAAAGLPPESGGGLAGPRAASD